ncbi:MAG: mOMP-like family protein [Parachlamydiales bacterium]|nr:mOMP-like family protein [Parachlamydiales bacterium]
MKFHFLIFGSLLGSLASAEQLPGCCPPNAMDAPCDRCREHKDHYGMLRSARPCQKEQCFPCSFGGQVDLSFLMWQAREDGLGFAIKNNPRLVPAPNLAADVNGSMKTIHFSWEPAFKLNFEMDFSNSWDFDARWTFFYTRSSASSHAQTNASTGSGLLPIWVLPQSYHASPNVFGQARGIWHLHLNAADLELGYHPFFTPKLNLRLYCGLKGISVSQQFSANYSGGIDDGAVTLLPSRAAFRNRCLGLGPRFGINSEWSLKKGWSLLADGAVSMSLSVFNLSRKDFDNSVTDNGLTHYDDQSKFRESFYAYRPSIEGLIGIGWSDCLGCRQQYDIHLKAAYEVQYYWDQNMMRQLTAEPISFTPFSMRGDLHLHGITTTLGFGF